MLSGLRLSRLKQKIFGGGPISRLGPTDILMGQARLGIDLESAKQSELYKYLAQRALHEHGEAIEEWLDADPTDTRAMISLQAKAKRLEAFTRWVDDAIEAGHAAHLKLSQQEYVDG